MPVRVVLIGAGGHARSVAAALSGREDVEVVEATDPDPTRHGTVMDGIPIRGGDERLAELVSSGVGYAVIAIGAVGDNRPRARLHAEAQAQGLQLFTVVAPTATVSDAASLAPGAVVLAHAYVGPGAQLHAGVIVNTAAVVEHDCRIGDHAHIASGAILGGGVSVGALAHVGLGAVVRQGIAIGAGALVAAGAVVVSDVPDGARVMGVPARIAAPRTGTSMGDT